MCSLDSLNVFVFDFTHHRRELPETHPVTTIFWLGKVWHEFEDLVCCVLVVFVEILAAIEVFPGIVLNAISCLNGFSTFQIFLIDFALKLVFDFGLTFACGFDFVFALLNKFSFAKSYVFFSFSIFC